MIKSENISKQDQINVAVIEDDSDIRASLELIIKGTRGFKCAGTFADYNSAVKLIPQIKPHVVLTDINLPGKSGIECVAVLKKQLPEVQFIMLTMYDDSELVFEALKAGATGYLLKRTPPGQILEAIIEVFKGGSPMSMEIARMVVNSFNKKENKKSIKAKLTEREIEILENLSKGMRYKEISESLFISVETVRTHLRKIYEKLQVRSATEAVIKYLQS